MKKTKRKKRASTSRRAAASVRVLRDVPSAAMVELYRAAEVLSAGKGRKATNAARQMLEAAAALGLITLIGESSSEGAGGTVDR